MPATGAEQRRRTRAQPQRLGLRERNKLDKLRRIKAAARALFIARGFDDATVREIAKRADVGMGTVFLYADDKRDLLFLVANDELEAALDKSARSFRPDADVLANLMRAFRPHYAYFATQPTLSRYTLREMMFYDAGKQAQRFQATRERLTGLLARIAEAGQAGGTLDRCADPQLVGWIAFCIYQVEIRRWLMSKRPELRTGLAWLEKALALFLSGAKRRDIDGTPRDGRGN